MPKAQGLTHWNPAIPLRDGSCWCRVHSGHRNWRLIAVDLEHWFRLYAVSLTTHSRNSSTRQNNELSLSVEKLAPNGSTCYLEGLCRALDLGLISFSSSYGGILHRRRRRKGIHHSSPVTQENQKTAKKNQKKRRIRKTRIRRREDQFRHLIALVSLAVPLGAADGAELTGAPSSPAEIHKIPDMYQWETVVDQLARIIVKVREVQMQPTLFYEGDYVRVRAKVLTAKPLTGFIPLIVAREGTRMLIVKYEKIPFFCKVCGLMGHGFEECGTGIWKEEDKKWGAQGLTHWNPAIPLRDGSCWCRVHSGHRNWRLIAVDLEHWFRLYAVSLTTHSRNSSTRQNNELSLSVEKLAPNGSTCYLEGLCRALDLGLISFSSSYGGILHRRRRRKGIHHSSPVTQENQKTAKKNQKKRRIRKTRIRRREDQFRHLIALVSLAVPLGAADGAELTGAPSSPAEIHKIPDMYQWETVVDQLARIIVKVREVQMQPTLFYEGDYVRVRAKVLTAKPLTGFIPLIVAREGTRMLIVKYEKIPFFCKVCGLMGHGFEECGTGIWKEEDKKWGGWMIAHRRERQFPSKTGGRFPSRGGRGEVEE
ncbi:hypothetical protein D1007_01349 [Hordeum vulgare]|nr:hypothetical protein D1007_01349 [Hordeum vulgare]